MSYALSYTQQPLLWCGLILGGAVALLGRFTHVASIVDNVLATPLGNVPNYIIGSVTTALARGEFATVLVVLTVAVATSVALFQFYRLFTHSTLNLARA